MLTNKPKCIAFILVAVLATGWMQPVVAQACYEAMCEGMVFSNGIYSMDENCPSMQGMIEHKTPVAHDAANHASMLSSGTPGEIAGHGAVSSHDSGHNTGQVANHDFEQHAGQASADMVGNMPAHISGKIAEQVSTKMFGDKQCVTKVCYQAHAPVLLQHIEFIVIPAEPVFTAAYGDECFHSLHLTHLFRPPRSNTTYWG